jgi:hypothetical protein
MRKGDLQGSDESMVTKEIFFVKIMNFRMKN